MTNCVKLEAIVNSLKIQIFQATKKAVGVYKSTVEKKSWMWREQIGWVMSITYMLKEKHQKRPQIPNCIIDDFNKETRQQSSANLMLIKRKFFHYQNHYLYWKKKFNSSNSEIINK